MIINYQKLKKDFGPFWGLIVGIGVIATILGWFGIYPDSFQLVFNKLFLILANIWRITSSFITNNLVDIWRVIFSLAIVILIIKIIAINKKLKARNNKLTIGYSSNSKRNIDEDWNIIGNWEKQENGEIMITNSNPGGILKKGKLWKNYIYQFDAKILNKCIGAVVRAQDFNNYYMIQIGKDHITPHWRKTIKLSSNDAETKKKNDVFLIDRNNKAGWKKYEVPNHNLHLNDWFHVMIIVTGRSVITEINNIVVFQKDLFLQIPNGKIGFRNADNERAIVKNIKVTLID